MRDRTTAVGLLFVLAIGVLAATTTGDSTAAPRRGRGTLVYFLRHTEDHVALSESEEGGLFEDCVTFLNDGEPDDCCVEVLTDLGELRASELARWFRERGITRKLTHVIASHKIRSRQTVAEIASDSGLRGDVDLNPGDGVQQVPPFVEECDSGFEIAHESFGLVVEALEAVPPGSVVVVSGHSGSIYPIMESFGIDISDAVDFPKRTDGKIVGYNNLWIVELRGGAGRLKEHLTLDLELVRTNRGADGDDDD